MRRTGANLGHRQVGTKEQKVNCRNQVIYMFDRLSMSVTRWYNSKVSRGIDLSVTRWPYALCR
jgi:hypothetical protein